MKARYDSLDEENSIESLEKAVKDQHEFLAQ